MHNAHIPDNYMLAIAGKLRKILCSESTCMRMQCVTYMKVLDVSDQEL